MVWTMLIFIMIFSLCFKEYLKKHFSTIFIKPLSLILLCISLNINAQEYTILNKTVLFDSSLILRKTQWGFDGENILCGGENNRGLYLFNIKDSSVTFIDKGIYKDAHWQGNGTVAFSRKSEVYTKLVSNFKTTDSVAGSFAFVNLDEKKLCLYSFNNSKITELSNERDKFYNPLLSPDENKVVVNIGANIYLLSTDGNGEKILLTKGISSTWSSDNKKIYFFRDETENGHQISNSDLYVFDLETMNETQLTFTKTDQEMWPSVSPDNSKIVYFENRSNKLYIADLKISE